MKVSAKSSFEAPPPGTHFARCIGLIGIGTHKSIYQGRTDFRDEIILMFEMPFERRSDGKPFTINQNYTRSLGKKANLRKALVAWRGRDFTAEELKEFEMKNILDKGCQIVCTQNDQGYVNITSIAGLPKGTDLPPRVNDLLYFDVQEFDPDQFEALPEYFKEKVTSSYEYREQAEFGRILPESERRLVDEKGVEALRAAWGDNGTAVAPAHEPVVQPAYDDDIPFGLIAILGAGAMYAFYAQALFQV